MKEMKNDFEKCGWFYGVIEKHVTAAVSCMVKTADLIEAVREFPWPFCFDHEGTKRIENPYYFCFKAIMDKFAQNQSQLRIEEPVDFVFDEETEKKRCLEAWDRLKYNASANVRRLLGDKPIYLDDKTTPPLQAADLYAYWVRDWEVKGVNEAIATLPFPWEKNADIPRMEIRFEKRDFLVEFQHWCDDPETFRRALMNDDEISQALKELKERDSKYMMHESEKTDQTAPKQELEFIQSTNFARVYANSVQIELTPWDFKLVFGELVRAAVRRTIRCYSDVTAAYQGAVSAAGPKCSRIRRTGWRNQTSSRARGKVGCIMGTGQYENRSRIAVARMQRRSAGVSAFRFRHEQTSFRFAQRTHAPRGPSTTNNRLRARADSLI
jgi:hypothetical protein